MCTKNLNLGFLLMIVFRKLFKVFSKQQQQQQSDTHFFRVVKKWQHFFKKTHKKKENKNFNKNTKHFCDQNIPFI
jgi:hypothetical protein